MISIIKTPRVYRDFVVYDLEWIPGTLQLRLVGVYCKTYGYRCYESIESFIIHEMTHKNRGKWFYAHAGGLADFQFLLEYMATRKEFRLKAAFSGSSAIIVNVSRGKNAFYFIDSLWLFRDTLRNIGKHVGIEKGNADENPEFYANAPFSELRDYNEIDCLILYKAIEEFENVLRDLGGQLKMTIASCGMELFRRRFLKADIDTDGGTNRLARQAYFASRVEVITTHCDKAYYYDVNSSFPFAMTNPLPGELIGTSKHIPTNAGAIYLADVTITVPDTYFPPMPRRFEKRLFFPTGTWRGWYSNIDIELLERCGGKILRCHQVQIFAPFTDLRDYVTTLYDLRKRSDGFEKVVYKYLMNCVYGKFAEINEKSQLLVNPKKRPDIEHMYAPGIFIVDRLVPIPHEHVPISVHITAIARRTLYEYMSHSSELHYCDTDGFSTTNLYRDGNELGDIKLEKRLWRGRFIGPKVYQLEGQKAEWSELPDGHYGPIQQLGDAGVRAKGFSKMTWEKFSALTRNVRIDGVHLTEDASILETHSLAEIEMMRRDEEIRYTRMRRVKEVIRCEGHPTPTEDVIVKRLQSPVSKRFFYPDGHSRPWHCSELEDMFHDENSC